MCPKGLLSIEGEEDFLYFEGKLPGAPDELEIVDDDRLLSKPLRQCLAIGKSKNMLILWRCNVKSVDRGEKKGGLSFENARGKHSDLSVFLC